MASSAMLRAWLGRAAVATAAIVAATLLLGAPETTAQTAGSPFGGFKHDASQPIEVAADSLEVRDADKVAVFRGDVDVRQGEMRMRADRIEVSYAGADGAAGVPGAGGAIDRLRAVGDVLISNGAEQAEAGQADYDVTSGQILLTGDVMLVQGGNVIRGERLVIDLASGVGRMEGGRIRTIISPSATNN